MVDISFREYDEGRSGYCLPAIPLDMSSSTKAFTGQINRFSTAGHYQTTTNEYNIVDLDEVLFTRLIKQWHKERGATSFLSEMIVCPSYLKIIGMGEKALPLILNKLRREKDDPDHWFTALEAITGEDPIPESSYGYTVKMAEAWLSWAETNNVW